MNILFLVHHNEIAAKWNLRVAFVLMLTTTGDMHLKPDVKTERQPTDKVYVKQTNISLRIA